eukprot:TRINITY_DN35406_c0_g1_i1.p1 TRINITY_DN35406_c0_g1~~TRINITY_DN35406_c0_g1_i1.p1  ORF type:complete len:528 (+),score=117.08 TRINITY_DN35406_c0_g1_i1:615-2198(+)
MDPLTVLQDYTARNLIDSISIVGEDCSFGTEFVFPKSVETAKGSQTGGSYTLETLVFFVRCRNLRHVEYMQQARGAKLSYVAFTDRKPMLELLEGRVPRTDAVDVVAPLPGALATSAPGVPHGAVPLANQQQLRGEESRAEANEGAAMSGAPTPKRARLAPEIPGALAAAYPEGTDVASLLEEAPSALPNEMELLLAKEKPVLDREEMLTCLRKKNAFASLLGVLAKKEEERKRHERQQAKELQAKKQRDEDEAAVRPALESSRAAADDRHVPGGGARVGEDRHYWDGYGPDEPETLGIDQFSLNVQDTRIQQRGAVPSAANQAGPNSRGSTQSNPSSRIPSSVPSHRSSHSSHSRKPAPSGPPIILVPNAASTLINIFNVKEFLENGLFVKPEEAAKGITKKPEVVEIYRKFGRDKPVLYHARDRPTALNKKEWERVVAVFVLGKEWQFKDWPFKDYVEVLGKLQGAFVRFEDSVSASDATSAVRHWNVVFVTLSKHKRHQDRTAARAFWDKLDTFLSAKKSSLLF